MNASSVRNQSEIDLYVSDAELRIVTLTFAILLIPLVCLLGIIGNIFSLVVLFNQRMRNQTNSILAALCVSDIFFLIHCLIFTGLNFYKKANPIDGEKLRAYVYPIFGVYGSVVTARITSSLTTLLCIERFVAVFLPMQARNICSKRNTRLAIIGIFVITLVSFIPFLMKYHAVSNEVGENLTFTSMNTTSFYENNLNFYKVYGTVLNIIFRFAPLVIIPILNIIVIRVVHKTWKKRRSMSTENTDFLRLSSRNGKHYSSNDQNHITFMLLTVSFVFLICILPGALNSIATHVWCTYNRLGELRNLYMVISTVTFFLETFNSSVNFIIYMAISRKFRLLFKEMFCCGHGKYYRKISLSSVKERFRWSTSKKKDNVDNDTKFRRQTVSDIGPLVTDTFPIDRISNHPFHEIHSDGYNFKTESSDTCGKELDKTSIHFRKLHYSKNHRSYLKHLLRWGGKCETSLTIDNENGNGVICQVGACRRKSSRLSEASSDI